MALPLARAQSALNSSTRSAIDPLRQARRLLQLWHLASLDAPTVAIVWALAFAWTAGVHLEPWVPLLLGCGTWAVYIGDRLLDARRAIRSHMLDDLRDRHFFHWRYRHALAPIAICSATIAAALALRLMPLAVREPDSVIAAAALAYFSGVHSPAKLPAWIRPLISKEFLVGALFTAGCAAPVIAHLRSPQTAAAAWPELACLVFFSLLAWLNCAAIASWESSSHRRAIRICAAALSAVGIIAAIAFLPSYSHAAALVFAGTLCALLFHQLDRARNRFAPLTLRALADLVLLAPAVLLVLGAHRG